MIGDIILFLKTWWKQNVTCHHKYVYKELGNINFEKCGKVWKSKKLYRLKLIKQIMSKIKKLLS